MLEGDTVPRPVVKVPKQGENPAPIKKRPEEVKVPTPIRED